MSHAGSNALFFGAVGGLAIGLGAGLTWAAPAGGAEPGVAVLDTAGPWRYHLVQGTEKVRRASGELVDVEEIIPFVGGAQLEWAMGEQLYGRFSKLKRDDPQREELLRTKIIGRFGRIVDRPQHTPPPPAGWREPDFDDGRWPLRAGPFGEDYCNLSLICIRGGFEVTDPATAGEMSLSVGFQGGVAVFLNGREIARRHLPAGGLQPDTPADEYPRDATVEPDGQVLANKDAAKGRFPERFALRTRQARVSIPAAALRRGWNVLAIENHRSPAAEAMFDHRKDWNNWHVKTGAGWPRVGLLGVELSARAGAAVVPSVGRPAGVQVWNQPVVQKVFVRDHGERRAALRPIRIVAARNGSFSGQVVIGSDGPIRGARAQASALAGPGGAAMGAAAVRVRWAMPDGFRRAQIVCEGPPVWFDGLETAAPAEVAVSAAGGGAVLPVWVTVDVPRDAAPGEYAGRLTLAADGLQPVDVPIALRVCGWTLPDPADYATHVGMIQSPDSVALRYGVPMWSDRHWALLEKSFELLGYVGDDEVYLPLLCRTHFGNPHSMVRWVRRADGGWDHDFSLVDRYLALAVRHLGRKLAVVCAYCWEQYTGGMGWEMRGRGGRAGDRGVLFTVLDPATGALGEQEGPRWGAPEAREFWKPVLAGVRRIAEKHGVADALMVGLAGDIGPTAEAQADIEAALPGARWVMDSHQIAAAKHGTVGRAAFLLASGVYDPQDPAFWDRPELGRYHGWSNPKLVVCFPRVGCGVVNRFWEAWTESPIAVFRAGMEGFLMAEGGRQERAVLRGVARLGADFWDCLADARGRLRGGLAARYPESAWGQLNLNYGCRYFLAPGRDGAVATVRLEMMKEGLQEAEARVFLERALLGQRASRRLGDELAGRAQRLLDERQRAFRRFIPQEQWGYLPLEPAWYPASGWQEASAALYDLAGEVAGRLSD